MGGAFMIAVEVYFHSTSCNLQYQYQECAKTKFFVEDICMHYHCLFKRILINGFKHLSLHKKTLMY